MQGQTSQIIVMQRRGKLTACVCHFMLSAYIDSRGIAPTFGLLKELGGWPVLGDKNGGSWNESDYDLTTLLLNLMKYNNKPLINLYVYTDSKNSTTRIIYVSDLHYFVSFLCLDFILTLIIG